MSKYVNHGKIGGTAACVIATNNHFGRTIHDLWLELTGREEPDNLDWELRVQVGVATEHVNAKFYSHLSGDQVTTFGDTPPFYQHKDHDFLVAQLDGIVIRGAEQGVFEAKHSNAFAKLEDSRATYYPQLQHYMAVCDMDYAILSVIFGNDKLKWTEVPRDEPYIAELMERELDLWDCVQSGTPPTKESVSIRAPEIPTKTVSMEGNNLWASEAVSWLNTRDAAATWKKADKNLKDMAPEDAGISEGYGVKVIRSARGRQVFAENQRRSSDT